MYCETDGRVKQSTTMPPTYMRLMFEHKELQLTLFDIKSHITVLAFFGGIVYLLRGPDLSRLYRRLAMRNGMRVRASSFLLAALSSVFT